MSFAVRPTDATARPGGGAPSAPVLAVAIEPGRFAAGIVDDDGVVLVRDRIAIPNRDVWRGLEGLIRRVVAATPAEVGRPRAVGASCTGPIDLDAGAVSPQLISAWRGFPLASRLEELTGLAVHLDSQAAAIADAMRWIAPEDCADNYVVLLLDSSVESACVLHGRRLRGAHGNAASMAHITVEPNGLDCLCGAKGCLAAYASSFAIERELGRPLRRTPESVVERTGIMMGRAMASAAALLDVTTFYFSGAVVDVFGDLLVDTMRGELGARSRLPALGGLRAIEHVGSPSSLVAAAALTRVPSRV